VPPLIIPRLDGGGKTTMLRLIFSELKKKIFLPIFISFSDGFELFLKESHKQAIMRLIAMQLVDHALIKNDGKIEVDENELMLHIFATSSGKPVVLLIDDLNRLFQSQLIEFDAAYFLKKYFLNADNSYLVYAAVEMMDIDTVVSVAVIETDFGFAEQIAAKFQHRYFATNV
jgi:hypothetical protein